MDYSRFDERLCPWVEWIKSWFKGAVDEWTYCTGDVEMG